MRLRLFAIRLLVAALTAVAAGCSGATASPPVAPPTTSAATLTPVALPPPGFYFTDAFEPNSARIYKLENGQVSVFFERSRGGQIYSFNFAPDGTLYLVDANSFRLARIVEGQEDRFFTHSTYIRHIEFDPEGKLYFSEATGAGADGTIYTLTDTTPQPFYTVRLSEVDGFWAGAFAFDGDGALWLTSGNIVPSYLYKVEDGAPRRVLTLNEESMDGFFFAPGGHLVVANWMTNVYRYVAPDFTARETFTVPGAVHIADVVPLQR